MDRNDLISFEIASEITGISKKTLQRIKSGYLHKYIENNQFLINEYNLKAKEIQEKRHLAHCVYYAYLDVHNSELELSKTLSKLCGRSSTNWLKFLEYDLFSIESNELILNWYEGQMVSCVYEEVLTLHEQGEIDWEYYYY